MKRVGNLLDRIATRENVVASFHLAAKGKRGRAEVECFRRDFDGEVDRLTRELGDGTWQPMGYRKFQVRDPKLRLIHAAPFRDRVAHHALMRVCGPILERGAVARSYACRTGRGGHAAVAHAAQRAGARRYFLQMDIRRYFDSIPHDRLLGLVRREIKDGAVLDLLARIISSYQTAAGRGVPIGTLTSQYFANFYLDGMDRWIVEGGAGRDYLRYMDDFVLWKDGERDLQEDGHGIAEWLAKERGLRLKKMSTVGKCRDGMVFLGYRILPGRVLMSRAGRRRFAARMRACEAAHERKEMSACELQRRVDALLGWLRVADCDDWQRRILSRGKRKERGQKNKDEKLTET